MTSTPMLERSKSSSGESLIRKELRALPDWYQYHPKKCTSILVQSSFTKYEPIWVMTSNFCYDSQIKKTKKWSIGPSSIQYPIQKVIIVCRSESSEIEASHFDKLVAAIDLLINWLRLSVRPFRLFLVASCSWFRLPCFSRRFLGPVPAALMCYKY